MEKIKFKRLRIVKESSSAFAIQIGPADAKFSSFASVLYNQFLEIGPVEQEAYTRLFTKAPELLKLVSMIVEGGTEMVDSEWDAKAKDLLAFIHEAPSIFAEEKDDSE